VTQIGGGLIIEGVKWKRVDGNKPGDFYLFKVSYQKKKVRGKKEGRGPRAARLLGKNSQRSQGRQKKV